MLMSSVGKIVIASVCMKMFLIVITSQPWNKYLAPNLQVLQ